METQSGGISSMRTSRTSVQLLPGPPLVRVRQVHSCSCNQIVRLDRSWGRSRRRGQSSPWRTHPTAAQRVLLQTGQQHLLPPSASGTRSFPRRDAPGVAISRQSARPCGWCGPAPGPQPRSNTSPHPVAQQPKPHLGYGCTAGELGSTAFQPRQVNLAPARRARADPAPAGPTDLSVVGPPPAPSGTVPPPGSHGVASQPPLEREFVVGADEQRPAEFGLQRGDAFCRSAWRDKTAAGPRGCSSFPRTKPEK